MNAYKRSAIGEQHNLTALASCCIKFCKALIVPLNVKFQLKYFGLIKTAIKSVNFSNWHAQFWSIQQCEGWSTEAPLRLIKKHINIYQLQPIIDKMYSTCTPKCDGKTSDNYSNLGIPINYAILLYILAVHI